jgi:hypothetical protein
MRDWLSYRLSDLLLFSPRTYYRLFELYHEAVWPAQLVAVLVVVMIVGLLWRDDEWGGAVIAALLAASWLWVAAAFHLRTYATINWAARYFAALFAAEAVLLLLFGVARRRLRFARSDGRGRWPVVALLILVTVLPPLVGRAAGRTWTQVEVFALTPDATAIATLGLLLIATPRAPRVLLVAPLAWCAIGGATLWALESPEAWLLIAAGVVGCGVIFARRGRSAAREDASAVRSNRSIR